MNNRVTIMRGLPGSGKTTWWKTVHPDAVGFSTDDYRIVDGVYVFDPKTDDQKHLLCFQEYIKALLSQRALVVVDNTNCSALQIAPYYRVAEAFGYKVEIVTLYCTPEVAFARNTHGLLLKILVKMYHELLQPLPSWYKESVVVSPNMGEVEIE